MNEKTSKASKLQEWRAFFFICLICFPLLAIATVSGFGFIVWMLQIFWLGPPSAIHG